MLEDRWYGYNRGGQPKRIVSNYGGDDPDLYYVKLLQYTTGQQVWLYREFTCTKGVGGVPENITAVVGYQFRYDSQDARARYLVREIDPSGLTEVQVSGASTWHEYVGGSIFHDLSFNGQGGFDVDRSYVHGLGLVRMTDFSLQGDPVDYFHGDMLGTSRVLSDATGAVDHRLRFSAFGEPLPLATLGESPNGPQTTSTRYGYVGSFGYQHDGLANSTRELGALHVGARFYDPAVGRFWQRDPIGLRGGLNVYAYTSNSPTGFVDPDGTLTLGEKITVIGIAAILVKLTTVAISSLNLKNTPRAAVDFDTLADRKGPGRAWVSGSGVDLNFVAENAGIMMEACPGTIFGGPPVPPTSVPDLIPDLIPLIPGM